MFVVSPSWEEYKGTRCKVTSGFWDENPPPPIAPAVHTIDTLTLRHIHTWGRQRTWSSVSAKVLRVLSG